MFVDQYLSTRTITEGEVKCGHFAVRIFSRTNKTLVIRFFAKGISRDMLFFHVDVGNDSEIMTQEHIGTIFNEDGMRGFRLTVITTSQTLQKHSSSQLKTSFQ